MIFLTLRLRLLDLTSILTEIFATLLHLHHKHPANRPTFGVQLSRQNFLCKKTLCQPIYQEPCHPTLLASQTLQKVSDFWCSTFRPKYSLPPFYSHHNLLKRCPTFGVQLSGQNSRQNSLPTNLPATLPPYSTCITTISKGVRLLVFNFPAKTLFYQELCHPTLLTS
jgi:hypothetical protein